MNAQGHDAVRRICENWATMGLEDFREVMTEDCDYRNVPIEGDRQREPFVLPVMGVFELRDGRISAWRDYFELSHLRLR